VEWALDSYSSHARRRRPPTDGGEDELENRKREPCVDYGGLILEELKHYRTWIKEGTSHGGILTQWPSEP